MNKTLYFGIITFSLGLIMVSLLYLFLTPSESVAPAISSTPIPVIEVMPTSTPTAQVTFTPGPTPVENQASMMDDPNYDCLSHDERVHIGALNSHMLDTMSHILTTNDLLKRLVDDPTLLHDPTWSQNMESVLEDLTGSSLSYPLMLAMSNRSIMDIDYLYTDTLEQLRATVFALRAAFETDRADLFKTGMDYLHVTADGINATWNALHELCP